MTPPRAVTFDFWQTLVSERRGAMRAMQIERWIATITEAQQPRSEAELVDAFTANWALFEDRWRTNTGSWGATQTVDFVGARLGLTLADGLRAALIENFRIVGETAELELAPGVRECLEALGRAGCVLGIVCDVGLTDSPTLRARLDGFGLARLLRRMVLQRRDGVVQACGSRRSARPGRVSGCRLTTAAHIGDNERTDVAGAKALGMVAVQYTGLAKLGGWLPEQLAPSMLADHVVDDLAEVPERPRLLAISHPGHVARCSGVVASTIVRTHAPPPFEEFLAVHGPTVMRFLLVAVGPEHADDVYQETFLSALRGYRAGSRRRATRPVDPADRLADGDRPPPAPRARTRAEPSRSRIIRSLEPEPADGTLWTAVAALPVKQRVAVVLRHVLDRPYDEIADCSMFQRSRPRQRAARA